MGEIKVTPSQLRAKAGELRKLNGDFKTAKGALVTSEEVLSGMWEGAAQKAFRSAFKNDAAKMDNFYTGIERYIQTLEQIAAEYEKKEAMNAQIAGTRTAK